MGKLPAFQFYPGDWMKDPALRMASKAARGMWIDMLCLMFECEERGVLISGGKPWADSEIAGAVGGDTNANLLLLHELLEKGIAKRDKRGAIFNSRMVLDEQVRQANTQRQRRFRGGRNASVTPHVTPHVTPLSEDEVSSSSVVEVPYEGKPFLKFKCLGGYVWTCTREYADELGKAYPHLNVPKELEAAKRYYEADPNDLRPYEKMPRMIEGWMSRAKGKAGSPCARQDAAFGPQRGRGSKEMNDLGMDEVQA